MQDKISQVTKMLTNLTMGKGIIKDHSLQERPISQKDDNDPFAVSNSDNPCEQRKLRKDSLRQLEHINV